MATLPNTDPPIHWLARLRSINLLPYLLIAPTLFFVFLFTVRPTYKVLQDSQTYFHPSRPDRNIQTDLQLPGIEEDARSIRGPHDVNLAYFRAMFSADTQEGEIFRQVMKNTFLYVIVTVPASMALAFLFAMLVNRKIKGIGIARIAFFYPTMLADGQRGDYLALLLHARLWLVEFRPTFLWLQRRRKLDYQCRPCAMGLGNCVNLEECRLLHDFLFGRLARLARRCL